jgi:hypothetical protein
MDKAKGKLHDVERYHGSLFFIESLTLGIADLIEFRKSNKKHRLMLMMFSIIEVNKRQVKIILYTIY